jgi:YfiR/HmsC-like
MHPVHLLFLIVERAALNSTNRELCALRKRASGVRPRRVCCRRLVATLLAALVSSAGAPRALAQQNASSEYQVKAAFLFHFAQFVEWPPDAFKDADSPLTYCTIGEDPLSGALDQSLSGKTIGARPLRVQHLKLSQQAQTCQVLFIGASETRRLSEIMASVSDRPILTVGETEHFAANGGVIGFSVETNKVRFEINLEAAEKANLKISARLLALAKTVIGNPKGN